MTSNPNRPIHPEAAWAEARLRVEAYLRAHRVADPGRITRLAADVTAIARAQHRPGIAPLTAAMETLDAGLRTWTKRVGGDEAEGPAERLTRSRVALALGGVAERWPEHFLRDTSAPADLIAAMREMRLTRGPDVNLGHMAPRPEQPAAQPAPRWRLAFRWMVPRMVTALMTILSLIGAAFASRG